MGNIVHHLIGENILPEVITQDNYHSINETSFYSWAYRSIVIKSNSTVAIFHVKPHKQCQTSIN
jgi:hypothetical protein